VEVTLVRLIVRVTAGTAKDTLLATYNDLENVKTVMTPIKMKLPL
jgi:glutamate-1-semialdehyde aminotransferase